MFPHGFPNCSAPPAPAPLHMAVAAAGGLGCLHGGAWGGCARSCCGCWNPPGAPWGECGSPLGRPAAGCPQSQAGMRLFSSLACCRGVGGTRAGVVNTGRVGGGQKHTAVGFQCKPNSNPNSLSRNQCAHPPTLPWVPSLRRCLCPGSGQEVEWGRGCSGWAWALRWLPGLGLLWQ